MVNLNVNKPICDMKGQPLKGQGAEDGLTVQDALANILGGYRAPNGKEAIRAYTIGTKVMAPDAVGIVHLEDAEWELALRAIDTTGCQLYGALVIGQLVPAPDAPAPVPAAPAKNGAPAVAVT